jgi:pimeloyl-ACP methyl ester carboxylesterase
VSSVLPDPSALAAEMLEFGRRLSATLAAIGGAANARPGCSAKQRVWGEDKVALYRYEPLTRPAGITPVLICYALVNRPCMMDPQVDRSLIRGFLDAGLDVYLIDWGYPDGADRFNDLDDYINGYLHRCVQYLLDAHQIAGVNLLGVCQGGTFSLCYTALHPKRVKNLITMVTPVDFKTPENLLSKWVQGLDLNLLVQGGNVSGDTLNSIFLALMPFRLTQQNTWIWCKGARIRVSSRISCAWNAGFLTVPIRPPRHCASSYNGFIRTIASLLAASRSAATRGPQADHSARAQHLRQQRSPHAAERQRATRAPRGQCGLHGARH